MAYSRNLEGYRKSIQSIGLSRLNKGFKTQKGFSVQSSKKLKKSVSNLLCIARTKRVFDTVTKKSFKFRVNFITLTLPSDQIHSDKEIKKVCFEPFIELLSKVDKMELYCWKAERQVNGNLHFHLVTDVYIHYMDLRNRWNKAINKLGYVDRFYLKHGHYNPNSTDVHAPYKVKNVAGYLAKYLSKIEDCIEVEGRYYSCSHKLSQYKSFRISELDYDFDHVSELCNQDNRIFIDSEYFSLFRFGVDELLNSKNYYLHSLYIDYHMKLGYPIDVSGTKAMGSGEITREQKNRNRGNMVITEWTTNLVTPLPVRELVRPEPLYPAAPKIAKPILGLQKPMQCTLSL